MMDSKSSVLIKKTIQLMLAALLAKGLGFVREMILANYYGTSFVSDVYVTVQSIPAVIFSVFGITITTGFIPIYTELKLKKTKTAADRFANNAFNIYLIFSTILSVAGIVFSKQLVSVMAGGFTEAVFQLCNRFTKIIMLTSVAIILSYIYNAYLQMEGMFNQNSLMNIPYNVVQMILITAGYYLGKTYLLAVGLLIASFSQLVYLRILIIKRTEFRHQWMIDLKDENVRRMILIAGPMFISIGANQLNAVVDRSLATGLAEGSASALNYAGEVANIVTQVIIASLTTILYPKIAALFVEDKEEKNEFVSDYILIVLFLVMPLSALVFIFSDEIIQILFARGAFTNETVSFVGKALKIYALGIVGASFRDVFNKIFYSMKNTYLPMMNGVAAVIVNIILNLILIEKFEYLGLAFATFFSTTICTVLLFFSLYKRMPGINLKLIMKEFMKITMGMAAMSAAVIMLVSFINVSSAIGKCVIGGGTGAAVYLIILCLLREHFALETLHKVKKYFSVNKKDDLPG